SQGCASADVARTFLLFWLQGNSNGANQYLELFCQKSDISKQCVQKWLPLVAAAQSVQGKPQERELLLSWVNVVDYE
ncbi:MAG: aminoglycoside phosphotransferase, partial [Oscillospiraceae bacterium]